MNRNSEGKLIEDYLDEDAPIPGQRFACISYISPEKVLKEKEVFKMGKFMEYVFTDDSRPMDDFRKELMEGKKDTFKYENIVEKYRDWKFTREVELEEQFHEIQNFQTTTRGFKLRGVYSTEKEARERAKRLHRMDPNFAIWICQVGAWCPLDFDENAVQEQEYQEDKLNELVKQYRSNKDHSDEMYQQMKQEKLEKARKELEERKKKLKEETSMNVREDEETDVKNIKELRDIVDTSDKLFYDKMKKENDTVESVFKTDQIQGLDTEDPWIQRKKEQENNKKNDNNEESM